MPDNYIPQAQYITEFLNDKGGEFTTNEIRYFLATKPGTSPTNAINKMLIDLSPEYVEPVNYQGANHTWNITRENVVLDDLEEDLKDSYPNNYLTSSKFRSKL